MQHLGAGIFFLSGVIALLGASVYFINDEFPNIKNDIKSYTLNGGKKTKHRRHKKCKNTRRK